MPTGRTKRAQDRNKPAPKAMAQAIMLFNEERFEDALRAFLDLEVEPSDHPMLSYYLGLCYIHLGRLDESVLYLEQVVTSELSFAHVFQSRMILGYIYAVTDRFRLAEFEFNRLFEDGYESGRALSALAYVLYAQNKVAPSVAHLERALTLDPDSANALNSLGYILADQDIKPELAVNYCTRAVRKAPSNPAYLDSLGWAFFKVGRLDDAKKVLSKAVEIDPESDEIKSHLRSVKQRIVQVGAAP